MVRSRRFKRITMTFPEVLISFDKDTKRFSETSPKRARTFGKNLKKYSKNKLKGRPKRR